MFRVVSKFVEKSKPVARANKQQNKQTMYVPKTSTAHATMISSLLSIYTPSRAKTTNYKALSTIIVFQCILFHSIVPRITHSQQADIEIKLLNTASSALGSPLASIISNAIAQSSSSSLPMPSTSKKSPQQEMLFNSHQEEYNPWKFDPKSIYGTPYGGYGRATKSRLASLPLRLVAGSFGDDYSDSVLDSDPDQFSSPSTSPSTSPNPNSNDKGEGATLGIESSTYFTMRDGEGRQFVCKIYNDYELELESLSESVFDIAQERDNPVNDNVVAMDGGGDGDNTPMASSNANSGYGDTIDKNDAIFSSSSNMDDDETDPFAFIDADGQNVDRPGENVGTSTSTSTSTSAQFATATSAQIPNTPLTKTEQTKKEMTSKVLTNLEGVCAQFHKDWWSYEWCHGIGIVQFHIALSDRTKKTNRNSKSGSNSNNAKIATMTTNSGETKISTTLEVTTVEIEDMTPLGTFSERKILFHPIDDNDKGGEEKNNEVKQDAVKQDAVKQDAVVEDIVEDVEKELGNKLKGDDDDDNKHREDEDFDDDDYYFDNEEETMESKLQQVKTSSTTKTTTKSRTSLQPPGRGPTDSKDEEIRSIEIIDTFVGGLFCPEADKQREVIVHIKCCEESEEIQNMYDQHALSGGGTVGGGVFGARYKGNGEDTRSEEVKKAPIIFHKIEEKKICEYTATICTTLVCDSMLQSMLSNDEIGRRKSSSSRSTINHSKDNRPASTSSPSNDEFLFPSNVGEIDIGKYGDILDKKQVFIHRDDSIRSILDKALGVQCLSMNTGWWTYGFCHKTQIFQFHEDVSLDPITAKANTKIESRYILGKYDKKSSETFPVEEEIKHMYLPHSKNDDGNDDINDKSSNTNGEMADAYFVQEYLHGDTCEGSDVVDSAIKGGKLGDGKIERSTTVRFFCGSQKAIIRVDEDSTCHYVMDISVPELCVQKYFEIPHLKTQVVKCLPVN